VNVCPNRLLGGVDVVRHSNAGWAIIDAFAPGNGNIQLGESWYGGRF
jgi:hypothetical protein